MRALQGTWYGTQLDAHRISVSEWVEMAFTGSTATNTNNFPVGCNQPMTWNDRANTFCVQQLWLSLDRALLISGTTKPSFGGHVDFLYGTDYRFTLMRGLFNGQLVNPGGDQNWYGYDLPQFYSSVYFPAVMNGLELRVGRVFCPWNFDGIATVNSPFLSRSYAFNFSPFTHFGVMAILNIDPKWQVQLMAIDGHDVWVGHPAQQWRFAGKLQYTSPSKRWVASLATSLGQAEFNVAAPFAPTTLSTPFEPFGRNNLNLVDLVVTRQQSSRFSMAYETIYLWQYAPAGTPGFPSGYSTSMAFLTYAFYTLTPRLQIASRGEIYWDNQGQRTGFAGRYSEATAGLQWKPRKDVIVRTELRFDGHDTLTPFDNGTRAILFTAAIDLILRF